MPQAARNPRPVHDAMPQAAWNTAGQVSAESGIGHDFSRIRVHSDLSASYLTSEEAPPSGTAARFIGCGLSSRPQSGATVSPAPPPPSSVSPASSPPASVASACSIKTQIRAAPDGTNRSRLAPPLTVGVCEEALFTLEGADSADWTASAGEPNSGEGRPSLTWRAPSQANNAITITAQPPSPSPEIAVSPCTIQVSTVAPSGIRFERERVTPFGAGTAGAGMDLKYNFEPKNVSFGNTQFREEAGPASDVTGYFKNTEKFRDLSHKPNERWKRIDWDNTFSSDRAETPILPEPWSAGSFKWVIPYNYGPARDRGAGTEFTRLEQVFSINAFGDVTITKGDRQHSASVTRTPEGEII